MRCRETVGLKKPSTIAATDYSLPPPPPFPPSLPPSLPFLTGIVFIDEIDKLCGSSSADSSSSTTTAGGSSSSNKGEGVQRELLTLVEGTCFSPPPFIPPS